MSRFTAYRKTNESTKSVKNAVVFLARGGLTIAARVRCVSLKLVHLLSVNIMSRIYLAMNRIAAILKSLIRIKTRYDCMSIDKC